MAEAGGASIVDALEDADFAVFNSCAVTADAVADLRQQIRRGARRNPALRSVVMVCAAALVHGRDAKRSLRALPTVESLVGGADLEGVARALDVDPVLATARSARQSGARALLRIQDGCDEHCTFCATTLARGANRSRPIQELVAEAERLSEWHGEIVLTGVHIGTYGHDSGSSLSALVERLVRAVPRTRFRLSSVEATEVDDALRERLVARDGGLVPYLHAPLQSGSDRILKRMGRHWYTASSYAAAVERIVRDAPVFGLGADIIAGFPGESEDDHRATASLLESLPFTGLHVFPYSERPATAAERLGGRVSSGEIRKRARVLREVGERKADAYRRLRAGGEAELLILGNAATREGLTEDYIRARCTDPSVERGSRVMVRLEYAGGAMLAVPFAPTG
jgi:threonylcarbamoyladenosine tRNA methylthiotransferase MtaB